MGVSPDEVQVPSPLLKIELLKRVCSKAPEDSNESKHDEHDVAEHIMSVVKSIFKKFLKVFGAASIELDLDVQIAHIAHDESIQAAQHKTIKYAPGSHDLSEASVKDIVKRGCTQPLPSAQATIDKLADECLCRIGLMASSVGK